MASWAQGRVTQTFSWQLPAERQFPSYQIVDSLVQALDAAVNSVRQTSALRVTQAASWFPTGANTATIAWPLMPTVPQSWTTLSCAPVGAAVGSFRVQHASALVRLDWQHTFATGSGIFESRFQVTNWWQAVVNPGSISFVNDSAWTNVSAQLGGTQRVTFTAVRSLGPGDYSITFQVRGQQQATVGGEVSSTTILHGGHYLQAFVTEAPR